MLADIVTVIGLTGASYVVVMYCTFIHPYLTLLSCCSIKNGSIVVFSHCDGTRRGMNDAKVYVDEQLESSNTKSQS